MTDFFGHDSTPIALREYQALGMHQMREAISKGARSVLLVAPTGSGKTTWAADMIRSCREKGGRAMFLAPRRELVHQASARLRSAGIPHGVVMAQADHLEDLSQPIQVCSIDTLISRLFRKGNKIELPDFSLVIMDEAHLAVTERRKDLMSHWPKAILVGLTATPIRKDGRALGMMFEDMVQPTSVKALTEAGFLVPARYYSISKPDLARIKVTAGDYNAKALDDTMNTPTLVGDIVQHWMELAANRRTVVFCTSIKHSVAVCEQFMRNGVAAEHVDANTPTDQREEIFKRFTSGKTQILTNCFLASYGFDLPALSCVVLARPTKSLMLYLQMIGRGLRPSDGKADCLVLDHSGCVHQHGFADQERAWSLDGLHSFGDKKAVRPKEAKEVQPIECPECHSVFSKSPVCPECGYQLKVIGEYLETTEGKLVEIATGFEVDKEMGTPQFYQELKSIAEERAYKPGWAAAKYKDKFGDWPPRDWNSLPPRQPSAATRRWVKSTFIAWIRGKESQEQRAQA